MADLTVTATSTVKSTDAVIEHGYAGETITAGQAVYKSSTTGLYMKADSDSATAEARVTRGIALNGGAINQTIAIQKSGMLTLGATMTAGVAYYLSNTAGGICPVADIGSGEYVGLIGLASTTTVIDLDLNYTGVAL